MHGPKTYPITLEMLLGPGARGNGGSGIDDPDLREVVRLTAARTGVPCELTAIAEGPELERTRAEVLGAAHIDGATFAEDLAFVASEYVCGLERRTKP